MKNDITITINNYCNKNITYTMPLDTVINILKIKDTDDEIEQVSIEIIGKIKEKEF